MEYESLKESPVDRARTDIAAHKESHDDPHFDLIQFQDLSDEDFSMYADFMEGRLDEQRVRKRMQELDSNDPKSVSIENLCAYLLNRIIAKKAEEQLPPDETTLH